MLPVRSLLALKLCLEVGCARVNIYRYICTHFMVCLGREVAHFHWLRFLCFGLETDTIGDSRGVNGLKLSVSRCWGQWYLPLEPLHRSPQKKYPKYAFGSPQRLMWDCHSSSSSSSPPAVPPRSTRRSCLLSWSSVRRSSSRSPRGRSRSHRFVGPQELGWSSTLYTESWLKWELKLLNCS